MSEPSSFESIGKCACASCGDHSHPHGESHSSWPLSELQTISLAAICFVLALLLEDTAQRLGGQVGVYICYGVPYFLAGWTVLRDAMTLIARKDILNEFTLMCGATVAAIFLGELPEAVGVMLFYRIGEYLQEKAADNSRASIASLIASKPKLATLITSSGTQEVPVERVEVGQQLFIRAGDVIPLDGTVTEGSSTIDQSPLTGESLPMPAEKGSQVFGGTINLSGTLTITTTVAYAQSQMAQILELVEKALANKSPTERFITKFARYYTPAVVALATLVAIIPPLIWGESFSTWIYRALVLLVISCPCALLLSIPLGYFGGIGAASRKGILIKGGAVLDKLSRIERIVFDKTGTLTQGQFSVAHVQAAQGYSDDQVIALAASVEQYSTHPLAKAIVTAATQRASTTWAPQLDEQAHSIEEAGKGILVTHCSSTLLAGTAAWLEQHGIAIVQVAPATSGALVYIAKDGAWVGTISLTDTLKPEAQAAIARLKSMQKSTCILSGDKQEVAAEVAALLKVDSYKAELLPADKVQALESLGDAQHSLFVGDGINDAPALVVAGVGVAMGKLGSQAAIEAADAVILNDSPAKIADLLIIGNNVRKIVWQNIVLALGVKGIFMLLGIVGMSGLWHAVFADVGVALLAVLNATRAGAK